MRFVTYLNEEIEKPTKEMFNFFYKRTKEHIDRVRKNLDIISKGDFGFDKNELKKRGINHDKSKYDKIEFIPYVWLTWWFKEKNEGKDFEYPDGMEEKTREASKSHVKNNKHHPQYFKNLEDMSDVDIAEMVADWAAMSQELNDDLRKWADKNVGKKWKFNKEQVKLIYNLVGLFE